jgi:hypothetical protein
MTALNLAELPQSERDLIEADRVACYIRKQSEGMAMSARRAHAEQKLEQMPEVQRAMVKAAITARKGT